MDGTIVNSAAVVERQWRLWSERHNKDFAEVEKIYHGRPAIESMRLLAPELPQPESAMDLLRRETEDLDGVTEIAGARDFLKQLPAGRWAVVTSSNRPLAKARLTAAAIPTPPLVITCDDIQNGKPDPECFLLAAERLGFAPQECVVFEDAPAGIAAGHAAGMRVVGITSFLPADVIGTEITLPHYRNVTFSLAADGSLELQSESLAFA